MKSRKWYLLLMSLFLFSCATQVDSSSEKVVEKQSMIDNDKISEELAMKKSIYPANFENEWIITKLNDYYAKAYLEKKSLNEIGSLNLYYLFKKVIPEIEQRALLSKSNEKIKSQIVYHYNTIKKGDIILTVTDNPLLKSVLNDNSFHHVALCVSDPTSDVSLSYITTLGMKYPNVNLYNHTEIFTNSSDVVVLRLRKNHFIDEAVEYAKNQIGKPYNFYLYDKKTDESFYCSQLIWKSYLHAGINLDYNDEQPDDFGLVLPSDLLKSSELFIVSSH